MGYISEVVFAVEADAVPTMLAWCEKHPALKQLLFVQTDTRHLGDYDDAGSYLFHWGWIKWSEGYPGVEKFMKMMDAIDCKFDGNAHRFVRYGEDYDDSEHDGFAHPDINVQRSISF
jgi:hypothetical protein